MSRSSTFPSKSCSPPTTVGGGRAGVLRLSSLGCNHPTTNQPTRLQQQQQLIQIRHHAPSHDPRRARPRENRVPASHAAQREIERGAHVHKSLETSELAKCLHADVSRNFAPLWGRIKKREEKEAGRRILYKFLQSARPTDCLAVGSRAWLGLA